MPTVLSGRPDVARHLILGLLQLGLAGGMAYLLVDAKPPPQGSQNWARWGFGLCLAVPLFVLGVRNLHRLLISADLSADEQGLEARIPVNAFWMSPWLRTVRWSAAWDDLAECTLLDGRKGALEIGSGKTALFLNGREYGASLYDIDAGIRKCAPERLRARFPLPEAVRRYPSTPRLWIAVAGLVAVGITVALFALRAPSKGDPPMFFIFPGAAGLMMLTLAAVGRREAILDSRGFFLVHGRFTAFLTAESLTRTGDLKLVHQFPGFGILRVRADGEQGAIKVAMNQILGLGLPLADLEHEIDRRILQGFASFRPPPREARTPRKRRDADPPR